MKARVKATGEVVEVEKHQLHFADNSTEIYYRDIFNSDRYKDGELIEMTDDVVLTNTDWEAYRREVAKDVLVGYAIHNGLNIDSKEGLAAYSAVQVADALIAQIRRKEGGEE